MKRLTTIMCLGLAMAASLATAGEFSAWGRRLHITFAGYQNQEGLTNFPALVVLNTNIAGFKYSDFSGTNADLRFTDETRTRELNYEIEKWDTTGNSYVWVQVPLLTKGGGIWAFWGRRGATPPACTTNGATWNSSFQGVWHLDETVTDEASGALHHDSTTNHRDGVQSGNSATNGVISRGQWFDGNDLITLGAVMPKGAYTKEAWAYVTGGGNLISGGNNDHAFWVPGGNLQSGHNSSWSLVSDPAAFPMASWQHVAVTYDPAVGSGQMMLYRNGMLVSSATGVPVPNDSPTTYLGAYTVGNYFTGFLDEGRISGTARSSNWIWACWMNMASNSAFNACKGVETSARMILNREADKVTLNTASLNGSFSMTNGGPATVLVYWGPTDGGTNKSAWSNVCVFAGPASVGAYSTNVALKTSNVTYYYGYMITNDAGDSWASPSASFIAGPVTVTAPDANASEVGPDAGLFSVTRPAGATNEALTIHYVLRGAASNGLDHVMLPGRLTLGAGVATTNLMVMPLADMKVEGNEEVTLAAAPGPYVVDASNSATVTIADAMDLAAFKHKMSLTLPAYGRPETATNFPALVSFHTTGPGAGFTYDSFLSPPYGDLRFCASNLTDELRYEVETWDTNNSSRVWVEVPFLTGTNTTIWAYWGKAGLSAPAYTTGGMVWSNGYLKIVDLEQNAEFSRAISLCTGLLAQGGDEAKTAALRALMNQLRLEKKAAGTLAFAIDSLGTQKEISIQELMKDDKVAPLLLRQAVREREGAILITAAALLAEMGDPGAAAAIVSRLKGCKDSSLLTALLGNLDQLKETITPGVASDLFGALGTADLTGNEGPLETLLSSLAQREMEPGALAAIFRRADAETTFKNRFAVAFLGMARHQWYENDPKAFDKAVESPGAAARLAEYMDSLAVHFDTKEADFLRRYSRYFPAAGAKP